MNPPLGLIIEDDPYVARALERQANRAGFLAAVDPTGDSMMSLARELKPCCIVLDVGLPGHDGRDLLAELKHSTDTSKIPVLMLSGDEDQYTRLTCLELGAENYEAKPPSPMLFDRLARLHAA